VAVAADSGGRLVLLLSELAEHTANLAERPEASLLIVEDAPAGAAGSDADPLARARVTLMGPCRRAPEGEAEAAREVFLKAHPSASRYASFKDFAIYRLDPEALRYVGGFGKMAWVTAAEYGAAEPDPLAASAAGILSHMNADHADTLLAYARALAGAPEAEGAVMTRVDRYGFEMRARTPEGERLLRLGFDPPVTATDEVRKAMIALARAAREREREREKAAPPG
jgi:putative heme iron utilization protein